MYYDIVYLRMASTNRLHLKKLIKLYLFKYSYIHLHISCRTIIKPMYSIIMHIHTVPYAIHTHKHNIHRRTYIGEEPVEEVAVDDNSMDAAERYKEEKAGKVGVVSVSNT